MTMHFDECAWLSRRDYDEWESAACDGGLNSEDFFSAISYEHLLSGSRCLLEL